MSPTNRILTEALRLSAKDRAALAHRLISSLESSSRPMHLQVEKAWQSEIQRRWSEVRKGKVKLIPWETVKLELRKNPRGSD